MPKPPQYRTKYKVAIIGSGPAGVAAADQLNKAGHTVTVYEKSDRIGGLMQYGIPNMKLDKAVLQRRIDLLAAEGITFVTNANVGVDIDAQQIKADNDAVILCTGAGAPRALNLPGSDADGVVQAMSFLPMNTKALLDSDFATPGAISAKGLNVVVIGGGDTVRFSLQD